jgi:hypothetical protein
MAFDQEVKQSVADNPVPSKELAGTSTMDTPSTEATPAKTECLESNALPNSDADPEPEKLAKAEIGTFGPGRSRRTELV